MQLKNLFWTKAGLVKLGKIIRSSREQQQLTLMDAATLIKEKTGQTIGFRTLASVETAVGEPKYNTLAAIAAAGFVEINGRTLNIFDFIAIASESQLETEINMDALAKLIQDHLSQNRLTLQEFAQQTGVNLGDLEGIMRGDRPFKSPYDQETDLILIAGYLTNPLTQRRFHTYLELVDYCGMRQDSTDIWQEDHRINSGQ